MEELKYKKKKVRWKKTHYLDEYSAKSITQKRSDRGYPALCFKETNLWCTLYLPVKTENVFYPKLGGK